MLTKSIEPSNISSNGLSFGSHHDIARAGDRAGCSRGFVGAPTVHPRHHRVARLYALERVPVSIEEVNPRHFMHYGPASPEIAVKEAGLLYLHLVVAAWGRREAFA